MNSLDDVLGRVASTPEKFAVLSAAGAVGLKNSFQAVWGWFHMRFRYGRSVNEVIRICVGLGDLPEILGIKAEAVSAEYELWKKGLIDDSALRRAILDFGETFRDWRKARRRVRFEDQTR
jgi:hypothetical protein